MRHVYDDCNHGNCRQEKRKEKDMNLSTNKNVNGELVDLDQACSITNLGRNTVRNLASSAGAIRKIFFSITLRKIAKLNSRKGVHTK